MQQNPKLFRKHKLTKDKKKIKKKKNSRKCKLGVDSIQSDFSFFRFLLKQTQITVFSYFFLNYCEFHSQQQQALSPKSKPHVDIERIKQPLAVHPQVSSIFLYRDFFPLFDYQVINCLLSYLEMEVK